jgi:hypothetical protein
MRSSNNKRVNIAIMIALFGILFFSLAVSSIEGMTEKKKMEGLEDKDKDKNKDKDKDKKKQMNDIISEVVSKIKDAKITK